MILFFKGLAPSSIPNGLRCFVLVEYSQLALASMRSDRLKPDSRNFIRDGDSSTVEVSTGWRLLPLHLRRWLLSCASCAPLTRLPSAENNERLRTSVKPSPSETANCLSGNVAVVTTVSWDWFLLSRRLLLLHIVGISHNSIRIYNWSIRGQEVSTFTSSL